uniref:Protein Wnt n=1 Tax=Caenorhabditis tropicalis TaxID=1561998 RepID=A0A1I7TDI0_9PELO
MRFFICQIVLFVLLVYAQNNQPSGQPTSPSIPYNWLTLAFVGSNDYLPRPHYHSSDREHFKELCRRLDGLNPNQQAICAENPFSIPFVARGVREAIRECENKFKFERWNCSSRDEVTETRHGKFQDILGKTLRSANKEAAFLSAIMAASIVHSITKGCNTGNLTECGCDSKPGMQRYQADSDSAMSRDQFSWGGCSDNVPYGVRYARRFLDEWETQQFEESKNVANLVRKHNYFVGREAIAQNIRRQCRCHGVSGSCEFKTCWLQMQKFSQVSDLLKKRYDHFAVQVELEDEFWEHLEENAFIIRTAQKVVICFAVDVDITQDWRYFSFRRHVSFKFQIRQTQCECKFVWCCEVKCKTCTEEVAVHTCK